MQGRVSHPPTERSPAEPTSSSKNSSHRSLPRPRLASKRASIYNPLSRASHAYPIDIREHTLIPRYTRPDMGRIWSDENRFRTWLAVEVAATETLAEAGMVPKDAAHAIRERADFNVERIVEIEAEVRHDVIAFTTAVAEIVGPHA